MGNPGNFPHYRCRSDFARLGELHPVQGIFYFIVSITLIAAGPRMTTKSTGRKNRIIGTVSLGGRAAAFFSASDIRVAEGKIDAFLGLPPEPQELRGRNFGRVIVNSVLDRPWVPVFLLRAGG